MRADAFEKLAKLAEDSRYDLACACGSSAKDRRRRSLEGGWLYPVPLAAGGYGIMLKSLLSNACSSDCRYCPLRHDGMADRCSLTPDEMAAIFMDYLRQRWLLGIFLSSGIVRNADYTMQLLTDTAAILRTRYRYRGYIHLKVIPGASEAAMRRALSLANAVSLNVEVPGAKYFSQLSQYKDFDRDIVRPLKFLSEQTAPGSDHAKIQCTTQFIVGAADESDREIVNYTNAVYRKLRFQRVYFSAYQPPAPAEFRLDDGSGDARLTREHRLYQADFLLRSYHFNAAELEFEENGNFDLTRDPKQRWADRHPEFFPVRVNRADREELLRIPGIGPTYAERILRCRRERLLRSWLDINLRGRPAALASRYAVFC